MMPTLMPTRNECVVYFEQQLDLTKTLPWLAGRRDNVTLYQLMLTALVRVWSQRPQLNRFTVGGKLYQRNDIAFSISVKKRFDDEARITAVKAMFDPNDGLEDVCAKVNALIAKGKSERQTSSEREMSIVTRLPNWLMRSLVRLERRLDGLGLLPAALTRDDPLYASAFVVNLGSLGLDAAYHHLYEYGTIPFFIAIGKIKKAPVVDSSGTLAVKDIVVVRYSFDERITDGFYCARSLDMFKEYVENPARLIADAPQSAGLTGHQPADLAVS